METKKVGKWVMAGLIMAAMAAPLPALAARGNGPQTNAQAAQVRPDCPNNGQQLRDGSGRTRTDSLHQNRGAGLKDGKGRTFTSNRGAGLRDGKGRTFNRGPGRN